MSRRDRNVPCAFYDENAKPHPAAVDCKRKCYNCGFNPVEQRRRLATGKIVEHKGIRTLVFKRAKV